jgi:hypothetical protein
MYSSSIGRWIAVCGIFIGALSLAGCDAIPVSQHPLSTAEDSVLDEQLFGQWDAYNDEQEIMAADKKPAEAADKSEPDPEGQPRFIIGKASDRERTHELVSVHVADTGEIETKRIPFFATQLGERKVISMNMSAGESTEFLLMRYEFVNVNRLLVYMLDRDFIATAIKKGELDGVVKSKSPADDPNAVERRETIRITAPAAQVRDFLKKHDKKAFGAKHAFRLQRASQQ